MLFRMHHPNSTSMFWLFVFFIFTSAGFLNRMDDFVSGSIGHTDQNYGPGVILTGNDSSLSLRYQLQF